MTHIEKALLIVLFWIPCDVSASINTLFNQSDYVFSGNIKLISGPTIGDLGTEHFFVTFEVDQVYKRRFVAPSQPIQVHWIVSNLHCSAIPMSQCITKHEGEAKVFFLKRSHFYEGAEIPDSLIMSDNQVNHTALQQLRDDDLIQIEWYKSAQPCATSCALCHDIEEEDWGAVKKYLARNANEEQRLGWMRHRAIKWVMPDRTILSSLPSYQSIRFLFVSRNREVESLAFFQIGYYKTFATWIPNVLYHLFNAQAYHHFSRENYDTMMLKSLELDVATSQQYLAFERKEYIRQIYDSSWQQQFGQSNTPDSSLVLLASVCEGPMALYEDYKTMPNYEQNAFNYVDSLVKHKKVYSLCLMSHHSIPSVAAKSVTALSKLNDSRAIPFLIQLANHEVEGPFTVTQFEDRNVLRVALISTLDELTGTMTTSRSYPYGIPENTWEMSFSIPLWQERITVID